MEAKPTSHQRKKVTHPSPDLFTRRLTSILMVQAGILPRSTLGVKELPSDKRLNLERKLYG